MRCRTDGRTATRSKRGGRSKWPAVNGRSSGRRGLRPTGSSVRGRRGGRPGQRAAAPALHAWSARRGCWRSAMIGGPPRSRLARSRRSGRNLRRSDRPVDRGLRRRRDRRGTGRAFAAEALARIAAPCPRARRDSFSPTVVTWDRFRRDPDVARRDAARALAARQRGARTAGRPAAAPPRDADRHVGIDVRRTADDRPAHRRSRSSIPAATRSAGPDGVHHDGGGVSPTSR